MGKYFKEEETSNRIKRFKTSDIQEKNLRFAQMSRVVTRLDKFLETTKIIFQTFIKTSDLIKVRPDVLSKLKSEFDTIATAQKAVASSTLSRISILEKEIKTAEDRKKVLQSEIFGAPNDQARNDKVTEIRQIIEDIDKKTNELEPLKKDYSKIEKAAQAEIDAKIEEFNQNNRLVTQLSWNRDLGNPQMDFLLPTGLSMKGLKEALFRMRPGTKFSEAGFLNFTRRNATVALNAYLVKKLENELKSIGFYKDKFTFLIKNGNEWKPTDITLYDFLENLAKEAYKSGQIAIKDDDERKRLQTAYANFLTKLDEAEKGWPLHPFFRTGALVIAGLLTAKGLSVLGININPLPILATLPQTWQRQQDLRSKTKMPKDMEEADRSLGIGDKEKKQIAELERLLLTPNLSPRARRSLERSIKNLKGGN